MIGHYDKSLFEEIYDYKEFKHEKIKVRSHALSSYGMEW